MEYVKIISLVLLTIAVWIYLILKIFKKKQVETIVRMDEYTTERYLKCLGDIINITTSKLFNAKVGELSRERMMIITDIDNPTMVELHESIVKEIFTKISDNMNKYLTWYFGKEWLISYVSDTVRIIIIENTKKLNISDEE